MGDRELHGHSLLQGPEVVVEEVRHDHQVPQLREQHDEAWQRGSSVVRELPGGGRGSDDRGRDMMIERDEGKGGREE